MAVQELVKPATDTTKTRKNRTWLIVSVCLFCALAVGIAALSVKLVMSSKEYRQQLASQAQQLTSLEQQLSENQKKLQELEQQKQADTSRLEEQEKTIRDQQSKLEQKDKTISDLKIQIAAKKAQNATPKPATPAPSISVDVNKDLANTKLVALTFDDGPGPYTAQLLDALKKRGIRATFFVLGSKVDSYPDLIRRMAAEGHAVGNHSQNHKNLKRLSTAEVKAEIEACSSRIAKLTGQKPLVMRCPGGNYNNTVKAYAKSAGLPIIQWDVDTRDWESRNVNAILSTAFQKGRYGIKDGSIVLMHDIYKTTLTASVQMMDRLAKEGYTFVTVPELLTLRGGMTAGQVYSAGYRS